MGLIVGILIAVVVVIGIVVFAGGHFGGGGAKTLDVNIHAPAVSAPGSKS